MTVYEVDISGICLVYPSTWYMTGIYQTYVVHTILYGFQMGGRVPALCRPDRGPQAAAPAAAEPAAPAGPDRARPATGCGISSTAGTASPSARQPCQREEKKEGVREAKLSLPPSFDQREARAVADLSPHAWAEHALACAESCCARASLHIMCARRCHARALPRILRTRDAAAAHMPTRIVRTRATASHIVRAELLRPQSCALLSRAQLCISTQARVCARARPRTRTRPRTRRRAVCARV